MRRDSHLLDLLREKGLSAVVDKYVRVDDDKEMERFLDSLSKVNLDNVDILRHMLKADSEYLKMSRPLPLPYSDIDEYEDAEAFSSLGFEMIRKGRVAFLIFSGGAATRLKEQFADLRDMYKSRFGIDIGPDNQIPKGIIPISPLGYQTFIGLFAEQILRLQYETGAIINLIIMVSQSTEDYIRRYFEENDYFGLMKRAVYFLRQEENPRLDSDSDLIFDGEKIITTGDGHGGVYRALIKSHLRDELIIKGVDSILMFNVDNPLACFADSVRIGYHFSHNADFTISVVRKVDPDEKIGVVAQNKTSGRICVVEYNLLDEEAKNARKEDGNLMFSCGHINVNIVNLSVIDRRFPPIVYKNKKVIVRNQTILTHSLEWLNQDIVQVLDREKVLVLGVPRWRFFLPTKNVNGADSIETTIDGLVRFFRRILDDSCKLSPNATIDLSPVFVFNEMDRERLKNLIMEEDSKLYIKANFDTDWRRLLLNKGLILERGSQLRIICKEPYGKFKYDYASNSAKNELSTASLVTFQYPLRIRSGVSVNLQIEESGRLILQCKEIPKETDIKVGKGETMVIE